MEEISNLVFVHFEDAAKEMGWSVEALTTDLPVTLDELRRPGGRFDWDVLVTLTERLEAKVGSAGLARVGHSFARSRIVDPVRRVAGVMVKASLMYKTISRFLAPETYRHARFSIRELSDGRLLHDVEILPGMRDAPAAWFTLIGAAMEALPAALGLPFARVTIESTARRATFTIEPPPQGLRDRWRLSTRLLTDRETLDDLVRHQASARQAERDREVARARERLAHVLLERANELMGIFEPDGRARLLTPGIERTLGHRVDSLIGQPLRALIHPDDHASWARMFASVAGRPEATASAELRLRSKDGAHHSFDITATNLLHDPIVRGLMINGRDITERKATEASQQERERAFSALLSNLHGMAYRCRNDADWTMDLVSPGALALTGYDTDELIGSKVTSFGALVHVDDAEPLNQKCQANLAARRACVNEYRIRTKSGDERWVLDVASGVYGPSGELTAIEGFVIDVTNRRKLEEQLSHSQKLEGIGRLAGGIAHDFNNLLGAMLSYADLVLEELPATSAPAQDVAEIRAAVLRAADLTRQLLAFARKQVIQPRVLDLNQTVLKLERLLRRVVGADINLTTLPAADLWAVSADPGQIDQVLLNLAVNARDAMPNGGQLTIETQNVTFDGDASAPGAVRNGDYVMLAVGDSGEGMTAATKERVFEPFFTTKGQGGSGLGLATCHGIVHQAGGHILVESEPGRGSVFKIFLPRSRRALDPPAAEDDQAPLLRGRGEFVLLVEDHPQLREVMVRTLSAAGYQVLVAEDGAAALGLEARHIDLLVTDIVMPGMSGRELAERMTATRGGLRLLFVSGYTESSTMPVGVASEHVHFLAKPFSASDLRRKVREVLDVL